MSDSKNLYVPFELIVRRFSSSVSNCFRLRPTMMAFGFGTCVAKALRVASPIPLVAPTKTAVSDSCLVLSASLEDLTSLIGTMLCCV